MSRTSTAARAGRPRTRPPGARVLVLSGSVGAGHDGAAEELAHRLRRSGVDVDVRDYLDALPRWFRVVLRDGYTLSVGRAPLLFEWLFRALERSPLAVAVLQACCRWADATVAGWCAEHRYAAVVSTYPLASQTLGELRGSGRLAAPVVTYLTDPAAHRSWVHRSVDLHLTVTSATARQGTRDYGLPMRAAGPLVPRTFAGRMEPARRAELRSALGLGRDARVALLTAGSLGLGDLEGSASAVLRAGLTPLVLCGRNTGLRDRLARVEGVCALGWRDDVHELMQVADVLVHNAGGLGFTESLVAGLPAVSYRCIPGHGLANAAVLAGAGLAPWAHDEAELAACLALQSARGRQPEVGGDPCRDVLQLIAATAGPLAAAA